MDPRADEPGGDGLTAALAVEALKKSSVLWLDLPGPEQPRAAWHVFVGGAAAVVHGGQEQQLPGLSEVGQVVVLARSKDTGGLLVRFTAAAQTITPTDPRWAPAAAELHARRQSPPDGEAQPARWAAESWITLLVPEP